jgi:hypothetical protein
MAKWTAARIRKVVEKGEPDEIVALLKALSKGLPEAGLALEMRISDVQYVTEDVKQVEKMLALRIAAVRKEAWDVLMYITARWNMRDINLALNPPEEDPNALPRGD